MRAWHIAHSFERVVGSPPEISGMNGFTFRFPEFSSGVREVRVFYLDPSVVLPFFESRSWKRTWDLVDAVFGKRGVKLFSLGCQTVNCGTVKVSTRWSPSEKLSLVRFPGLQGGITGRNSAKLNSQINFWEGKENRNKGWIWNIPDEDWQEWQAGKISSPKFLPRIWEEFVLRLPAPDKKGVKERWNMNPKCSQLTKITRGSVPLLKACSLTLSSNILCRENSAKFGVNDRVDKRVGGFKEGGEGVYNPVRI